jgi:hypothetical protein
MAKNKISISFPEKKLYLYTYLKSKDNISTYVCNLIESDMNDDSIDLVLQGKIEKIIDKILKDKQLNITTSAENYDVTRKEDTLTTDDIDIIKGLF